MILVDSNVIIDVGSGDARWSEWSKAALSQAADRDEIAINPIIYAEISAGFATMEALDAQLGIGEFRRLPLPYEAGFVAGRARGLSAPGRSQVLPAARLLHRRHAAVSGLRLLTRDPRRYANYFPRVALIAPD